MSEECESIAHFLCYSGCLPIKGHTTPLLCQIEYKQPPEVVGDGIHKLRALILDNAFVTHSFVGLVEKVSIPRVEMV